MSYPRCTSCGTQARTQPAAALVEAHEMCYPCRVRDLTGRADYLAAEITDLAADLTATTDHTPVPIDLEVRILLMLAATHHRKDPS